MVSTKAGKQGSSLVMTTPTTLGVKEGEEFVIPRKNDGFTALIPKVKDPSENTVGGELHLSELAIDYSSSEGETDGL